MWHWEEGPELQTQQVDPSQHIAAFFLVFSCMVANILEETFVLAKIRTQANPCLGREDKKRQVVFPLASVGM